MTFLEIATLFKYVVSLTFGIDGVAAFTQQNNVGKLQMVCVCVNATATTGKHVGKLLATAVGELVSILTNSLLKCFPPPEATP